MAPGAEQVKVGCRPGEPIPVACSLSSAALGDREADWRALLDASLSARERVPAGVRLVVRPAASAELARLIDLERECCAWMQFEFDEPWSVVITADEDGADVLATMFLGREAPAEAGPGTG